LQVGAVITFLSAVGGNLVASILDRAAQGQQISEEELRAVLATPNELLAIRRMVEERGDLLQGLLDDIILAVQEIPLLRAESQAEHTLILRELNDIKCWLHEVGTGAVHEEEVKEHLKFHLELLDREEKAEDWLTVRGDKCCLLQERGGQLFSFLHQTFQEYLAAMDLYQDGRFIDEVRRTFQFIDECVS